MTRRERNIRRAIFFTVLGLTVLLICGSVSRGKNEVYEPYTVMNGDTLWGIAEDYKPNNMSYREYIYLLRQHNGIGADIKPGQAIEVLIWEE